MDLHPMPQYAEPRYPTRTVFDEHPALLRLVPRRWRRNAIVLSALTTLCGLLAGCRTPAPAGGAGGGAVLAGSPLPPPSVVTSHVAPLFQQVHDERGGIRGKVAMPKFLSESEARDIIAEEARRQGIAFTPDAKRLDTVPLMPPAAAGQQHGLIAQTPLTLDGVNEQTGLAYEFVSQKDYALLHTRDDGRWAFRMEMQDTAQALRDGLASLNPPGAYAVFYDPVIHDSQQAREALRQQVRDFITWLKAEGVI